MSRNPTSAGSMPTRYLCSGKEPRSGGWRRFEFLSTGTLTAGRTVLFSPGVRLSAGFFGAWFVLGVDHGSHEPREAFHRRARAPAQSTNLRRWREGDAMNTISYSEKLRDPRWQKKRLEILSRDKWTCLECGEMEKTLHVHHLYYCGNPWDVPSFALRTLCESCHDDSGYISGAVGLYLMSLLVMGDVLRQQGITKPSDRMEVIISLRDNNSFHGEPVA